MTPITRRRFVTAGAGLLAGVPAERARAAFLQGGGGRPKNVLLMMGDQHRPDGLGIERNPYARTPNLDALARSGVRFGQAYCPNPVCVPSRASLLTGLFSHHHGAYNNTKPWPFEHKTVAHHFGRAGYMTGLVGKMHFVDAQTHGFDYHVGFNDWFQYLGPKTQLYADELGKPDGGSGLPEIESLWEEADPWEGRREKDEREGPNHVGRVSKIAEQDHFDDFAARESVRFLKEHGRRQPFLLVTSFLKPHNPFMPAERFARMFPPEAMKLPATWGKVDLNTVPKEVRQRIETDRATPEMRDAGQAKRRMAFYYGNLAQMDDCAGRVLRALRELDLEKDTIVIYTSDHGDMLGEHGLWAKFVFYESSVRVPFLWRVPGLAREPARCMTPVNTVQVLPTLLELCGLPAAAGLDGVSLARELHEPAPAREAAVFSEFALKTPRAKYMIRQGDFKYCYYANDMPELYNLREDPDEMRNLAQKPEYQGRVEELKARLFAWYRPTER